MEGRGKESLMIYKQTGNKVGKNQVGKMIKVRWQRGRDIDTVNAKKKGKKRKRNHQTNQAFLSDNPKIDFHHLAVRLGKGGRRTPAPLAAVAAAAAAAAATAAAVPVTSNVVRRIFINSELIVFRGLLTEWSLDVVSKVGAVTAR